MKKPGGIRWIYDSMMDICLYMFIILWVFNCFETYFMSRKVGWSANFEFRIVKTPMFFPFHRSEYPFVATHIYTFTSGPPRQAAAIASKGVSRGVQQPWCEGNGGSMGTHEEWEMMRASSCIPMLCWRPNSVADPLCLVNLVKYHFRSFNPRYEHLDPSLGLSPKPVLHSHEHWLYSSAVSRH